MRAAFRHRTAAVAMMLAIPALLAGCATGSKIGSTVKGTRIAVLEPAKALQADATLHNEKITLPPPVLNLTWQQAGYDREHIMPDADMAAHPSIVWTQGIGEGSDSDFQLLAHPVVSRADVYTMDAQGLVTASDAKTGDEIWQFDTTPPDAADSDEGKAMGGGLALDGGVLYATTGYGDVYALDARTGALRWRKALMNPLRAAPTIADNRVYVVSLDNELNALDAATGDVLWHNAGISENATLMGAAGPAVEGDNVFVAYNSGEIFNLRAQNGRASWSYSLSSTAQQGALPAIADIRGQPVVDRDRVFAISHSGVMAAIDAVTGNRAWEIDLGGIDTPVVAGNAIFVYGSGNQLAALDRDTGGIIWTRQLAKRADPTDKDSDPVIWTGPILAGGRLWMVNSMGQLASFIPANGAPDAVIDVGGPVYLSPVVANRIMYVMRDDGTLVALK